MVFFSYDSVISRRLKRHPFHGLYDRVRFGGACLFHSAFIGINQPIGIMGHNVRGLTPHAREFLDPCRIPVRIGMLEPVPMGRGVETFGHLGLGSFFNG